MSSHVFIHNLFEQKFKIVFDLFTYALYFPTFAMSQTADNACVFVQSVFCAHILTELNQKRIKCHKLNGPDISLNATCLTNLLQRYSFMFNSVLNALHHTKSHLRHNSYFFRLRNLNFIRYLEIRYSQKKILFDVTIKTEKNPFFYDQNLQGEKNLLRCLKFSEFSTFSGKIFVSVFIFVRCLANFILYIKSLSQIKKIEKTTRKLFYSIL